MKKPYLLLLLIIFFNNNLIQGCGCTTDGPFLQVATGAELIAVIEVQDYSSYEELMGEDVPMSMVVKIKQVLKGEESQSEITIWGNNGMMCSPYLSLFDIGTTWVMAFKKSPTEGHKNAQTEDYGISNCGEHFMKIESGVVRGLITGGNSYQSMSIATLKKNLDIINREESRIDHDKCIFIQQLVELGVDTIGVFENFYINKIIRSLKLSASFQMSIDEAFPGFYDYMQKANINRQIFVYWQFHGKTYVKQIDNLFDYDAVEVTESKFFETFLNYRQWLIPERLHLPMPKKHKKVSKRKKLMKQKLDKPKQKVNLLIPKGNKRKEAYALQSFQIFIDGSVFLRDFDTRLFEKAYNPAFYKKNRKMLTYNWLELMADEAQNIAIENEKSYNLFRQYKRLVVTR